MKNKAISILGISALLLSFLLVPTTVNALPAAGYVISPDSQSKGGHRDDRQDPLSKRQRSLRKEAKIANLKGKAYGRTHQVARGQFVELERQGEDPVWTVLGEFNDLSHNSIEEPDRTVDNTTIWREDFSRDYYLDMLFDEGPGANSMRNYYIEQSSNRYTVYGDVTDWISLPGNLCDYDDGDPGPGSAIHVWQFLIDSLRGWYDGQIATGKTPAEIDAYLSDFDVWDRYDWDGDGNFDEPDGYIDRMQFVHAGEGNEAVGVSNCAIWSHSWFAYYNLIGIVGPSPEFLIGGVQIGNSSYWVNKYTIQPENGGVGVFAHEYAHDLGLPDLYDTSGLVGVIENSTGYWTLMSAGGWLSDGTQDIGSKPCHMGVWEKFQLGWLNYEVAFTGRKSEHKLGPAETNTKQAQGLFVVLPDKEVTETIAEPYSGDYFYYSGSGNDLDTIMYKSFTLAEGSELSALVNFAIEYHYDYAYLIVSTDGGATWESVDTNLSTNDNPYGQNFGYGITGNSGGSWMPLTADLSAYSGEIILGFRYWTDGGVVEPGFMIDDIQITGYPLDDAESEFSWTFDGFRLTTGTESGFYFNAYVGEFRQYRGFDDTLQTGPYSFGYIPNFTLAERFPYQDGLLISYWDTSFADNDVFSHCLMGRCGGLLLPIDAHPEVLYRPDGGIWVNRVQTYDSTFGLEDTDPIMLHWFGVESYLPSLPAEPVFNDTIQYYRHENPWGGVINPHTGTQIRVKSVSAHGTFMQVEVRPSK